MEYFGWVEDVPGRGRHSQKESCLSSSRSRRKTNDLCTYLRTIQKGYDLNSGKAMCGPGYIYVSYAKEFKGFGLKVREFRAQGF